LVHVKKFLEVLPISVKCEHCELHSRCLNHIQIPPMCTVALLCWLRQSASKMGWCMCWSCGYGPSWRGIVLN